MRLEIGLLALLLAPSAVTETPARKADAKEALKKDAAPAKKPDEGKAEKKVEKKKDASDAFSGLEFRGIGPALTSGRINDLAVQPGRPSTYYVAVASGGVWKTTNGGTSYKPIFDSQGSYSIGCVSIDPRNPLTVWVGSGEYNSQRSVAYGDGVYKSVDAGKTWENVGLKSSEHIGRILIDPRTSNTVYVAAQGPLWNAGGDRGLFKTTDGGKTWKPSLSISENTGVSDVVLDPRNPDVLYAAAYQRRRHVFTLIDGGPESAIHKSTDAGATWKKLSAGLPKNDMGRIGIAVSPVNPDVVFAVIEAAATKDRGFYRSTDAGGSFEKMSDYCPGGPQYYNRLFPDPKDVGRVYSVDVFLQVTEDGGKTFKNAGEKYKHVDNHVVWIDPDNNEHLLNGNDGGVYESFDRAATWSFKANLPVTQFYRVTVDESAPFYNVYGGTQDNYSLGGPSRTATSHGITNADWFVTNSGDGFVSCVDPKDPNIVYAESQHAGLVRFDRKTGEKLDIQPQAEAGDPPLRWNWDSPLLISPHSHTRLYFAAQRVYRSDDRGDTWKPVSGDLTAQIDRNRIKVMGRVWGPDAVAKNSSTSFYGNIVSMAESPKAEGLLYVGTDDGLVQVTEDAGGAWRKHAQFPGVPAQTYVSDLEPSPHDAAVVYASFDNHQNGDYKPYLLKSGDRGRTWTSIAGDLPEKGTVYTVAEDPAQADLLFAGTEFGVFFTRDGGKKWIQLKGGMPTIAVRDIAIQRREGDLVLATFGRGFYILDDLTALRRATPESLEKDATLFPARKTWMFVPQEPLGLPEKAFMGEAFYSASNPPFGAVFTYHLKDELKSKKASRQEDEKKAVEKGEKDVYYPTWEALRAEAREEEPAILLTVSDSQGNAIRTLTGPAKAGFQRVAWDLRYPAADPTQLKAPSGDNPFSYRPTGPLAMPGTYTVTLAKRVDGTVTPLGESQSFTTEVLGAASLPAPDRASLLEFQKKTSRLQRAVLGAVEASREAQARIEHLKAAIQDTPGKAASSLAADVRSLEARLKDLNVTLSGDNVIGRYNEPTPPSLVGRVQGIVGGHWTTTSAPTATHKRAYEISSAEFAGFLPKLTALIETDLKALEEKAEAAGVPWTPGRVPRWTKE